MDRETQVDLEARLEDRLRADLGRLPVHPYAHYRARERGDGFMTRGLRLMGAASALAVLVLIALGLATYLRDQRNPTATPTASPSPSAGPSASAVPAGTFENLILGYRVTLPQGYRRSISNIVTGQEEFLGLDYYTLQTDAEAREACQRDLGDVGSGNRDADLRIGVSRNVRGISLTQWVSTPRSPGAQPLNTFMQIEPVTLGGRDALRLVQQGQTMLYVISVNDRVYELGPTTSSFPSRLASTYWDDVAKTFTAITPQAFPSPTATVAPRVATLELGQRLAAAFAAKDADAVARLISPRCWLGVYSTVPSGGASRSIAKFIPALREQFASGVLSVTVDPVARLETNAAVSTELYFVRSTWNESGRITPVDLILREVDGRWYWAEARHHHEGGASFSCLWVGTFYPNCP